MMKKWLTSLACLTFACTLAGCSNTDSTEPTNPVSKQSEQTEAATEIQDTEKADETESETENRNLLAAYFSATGTTEEIARELARGLNADTFAIEAVEPYSDEDLDYGNDQSRTSVEQNDPEARPEISNTIENMDDYDIIFLGYPIWWGKTPAIIQTFLESYDWDGKTIIPFCTSGGSGIENSISSITEKAQGATVEEGRRFSGSESQDVVAEWGNGYIE